MCVDDAIDDEDVNDDDSKDGILFRIDLSNYLYLYLYIFLYNRSSR